MALIDNLREARMWLDTAVIELETDPTLADNPRWRDNLAQTGYQIESLLSEFDDEDDE